MILRGDHCQCGACGLYFNSTYAFDKHRDGPHGPERRCLTGPEMLQRKMGQNAGGWWISGMAPNRPSADACNSRRGDPADGEKR